MKYALRCFLFFLIILSCKQDDTIVPEEGEEEIVVTDDDDDDEVEPGDDKGGESNAAFPLVLAVKDIIPNEIQLTSVKIHPSAEGGVYLAGYSSSVNISDIGLVNWTADQQVFHNNNTKEVFSHDINNSGVSIYQVDHAGEGQLVYSFSNNHGILPSSSMILMGASVYFYWLTGQPGSEHVLTITSLDLEGQLNWKKEFAFEDYIYSDVVAHKGQLFVQYGNYVNYERYDDVHVAVVDDSGDIINDFELTTNLADWNKAEPLVEIQVDDDFIYSNTTKNDYGLYRKSRIAKYTYGGDLVSEVEIPYSRDFYVIDKEVHAVGNDYEVDADIRKGHPFVIHLDENLNVLNEKKYNNIETNWNQITVSDDVVYYYFYTYRFNPEIPQASDSLYIDTLRVK